MNSIMFSQKAFNKRVMAAFLIFSLFFSSTVSFGASQEVGAAQPGFFRKAYDAVTDFVVEHDVILTPISNAFSGYTLCGYWCALAGAVLGGIDEGLVRYGYLDKRYLSYGVIGGKNVNLIKPGVGAGFVGAALGVLVAADFFKTHDEYIAPVIGSAAGASTDGLWGGEAGFLAGSIDQWMIENNITDHHYLTSSVISTSGLKLLGFNPMVSNFIGSILGILAANYSEEVIVENIKGQASTINKLYDTYNKFIPADQLDGHAQKQLIALFGTHSLTESLSQGLSVAQTKLSGHSLGFRANDVFDWGSFKSNSLNFAVFLFPYLIGDLMSRGVNNYFSNKLTYALEDAIDSNIFAGENALILSGHPKAKVSIDQLKRDIPLLASSGSALVNGALSTGVKGVYGLGVLVVSSPNVFIYSLLWQMAFNKVSSFIMEQAQHYYDQSPILASKLTTVLQHDTENIRLITAQKGVQFTENRVMQLSDDIRQNSNNIRFFNMLHSALQMGFYPTQLLLNDALIMKGLNDGKIKPGEQGKINQASWDLSSISSWVMRNKGDNALIDQALQHIIVLEGVINLPSRSKDYIERDDYDGDSLVLSGLSIGVAKEDRELFSIPGELRLQLGKHYVITGKNASGKSSLLMKINRLREDGISGNGTIKYPKIAGNPPKIVMVTQDPYFPAEASLKEAIFYPQYIDKSVLDASEAILKGNESVLKGDAVFKEKVEKIVQDMNKVFKMAEAMGLDFYGIDLDEVKTHPASTLNGGAKKKLKLISAILQKPDILLIDEGFNELDRESIRVAQSLLKEYLPNSLILVVDHQAENNNYDNFYDNRLHFEDGGLTVY